MIKEPIQWQETHSPTVIVRARGVGKREIAAYVRREADERLWSSFTQDETRAAEEIARVWNYTTGGMTARAQQYERLDRGQDMAPDLAIYLKEAYRLWRARLAPVERSACISVLCESMTIREAARAYKRASAWPRANLGKCLEQWIEIRGWALDSRKRNPV